MKIEHLSTFAHFCQRFQSYSIPNYLPLSYHYKQVGNLNMEIRFSNMKWLINNQTKFLKNLCWQLAQMTCYHQSVSSTWECFSKWINQWKHNYSEEKWPIKGFDGHDQCYSIHAYWSNSWCPSPKSEQIRPFFSRVVLFEYHRPSTSCYTLLSS